MTLSSLADAFSDGARGKALTKALSGTSGVVSACNLAGSSVAMMLASIPQGACPAVVVGDSLDDAGYIYHDLSRLLGEQAVAMMPSAYKRDIKYGQVDPPSQILRTEALSRWHTDSALRFVVTYPEALAERVAPRWHMPYIRPHTVSAQGYPHRTYGYGEVAARQWIHADGLCL